MKLELPPHLEETRRLLEGSLRLRPQEPIPAVPAGLLEDLKRRFAPRTIIIEPSPRRAWLKSVRGLVASPAFGLAAAAVMVFGIVSPVLHRDSPPTGAERFRGLAGETAAPTRIVLVDGPADLENTLAHSGQFESDSLITVSDLAAAAEIPGPKVVLDFESATIRSISARGENIHRSRMPESIADLTLSVADALSRL